MAEVPYESRGSLTFKNGDFILDQKPLRILSGTMHYFRVVPEYWEDRLLKMKACGLNTVETYVAWNKHEEYPGKFDFEGILDVRKFVQVAQKVGLYVIFRPGPYICAEWDFGGLPSWLLADENMKVRSNYKPYQDAVDRFFARLLPLVTDLQHSKGGPIIAVQVENEYGSYSDEVEHLMFVKELLLKYGTQELLLTSENIFGLKRAAFYQHALPTANFPEMGDGQKLFDMIREWSPDFPLMVMEFWPGWFDHWGQGHKGLAMPLFENCLTGILDAGGSFNMYMFHGGTNFGFMAGANYFANSTYKPDITSYDYDAPLSEAGDITPKFLRAREIVFEKVLKPSGISKLPDLPPNTPKANYGKVPCTHTMSFNQMLAYVKNNIECPSPIPMEHLKIHGGYGQNYGYIVYRTTLPAGKRLQFSSLPQDRAQIFINGTFIHVIDWRNPDLGINVDCTQDTNTLEILVENHGRVNYVEFGLNLLNEHRKGLTGDVSIDGKKLESWNIIPLEFDKEFVKSVCQCDKWVATSPSTCCYPALFKATLTITDAPKDTFLCTKGWGKGIVFLNGFNLGRFWCVGPQQTLYVPAPLLQQGDNQILIFEQENPGMSIEFLDAPILDETDKSNVEEADKEYPTGS
ncbi:beta-galactosidase-1-like protein 2 [Pecten maximus]|uniref:beta-galactosidase-1-like protein 2 n=1 Tax=Pecten maximus TaxID=6579 RepID=UPI001458CB80|nr:beta-galactosidase-1-like protein 2 [Pecten maximus]